MTAVARVGRFVAVKPGPLLWTKLITGLWLVTIEATNVGLFAISAAFRTEYSVAAACLSTITALCILAMLYVEHKHSIQPSTLISIYLSITVLFDIAKARSYFNRPGLESMAGTTLAILVLKSIVIYLEEKSKRESITNSTSHDELGKEDESGFWNRAVVWWVNSTFRLGFKTIITVEDLPELDAQLRSNSLLKRFQGYWNQNNK
ncbi:hypothetical protein VHEMI07575 [[Torrubiella] hemipterigena]|uniref:ABC transporter TMD0 domain-containing protein n=1 Tax=[Torrubiella] hemipterigena TaxID=1531966 RepID=A0A0A1TLK6_9HYPO|nr:hypothetical protein VHEMI07575 [[Torrubiella] hemipterigena]